MTYNLVGKRTVPSPPYHYCLVCVPMEAIPYVSGALKIKKAKYWWETEDDHKRANDLLVRFQDGLLMDCTLPIVNAINAQTVMLRAYLAGVETTTTGDGTDADPFVYNPAISQEAYPFDFAQPSIASAAQTTQALVHNLVDGTQTSHTSETRNFRQQLADMLFALQNGDSVDDEEMIRLLGLILGAL